MRIFVETKLTPFQIFLEICCLYSMNSIFQSIKSSSDASDGVPGADRWVSSKQNSIIPFTNISYKQQMFSVPQHYHKSIPRPYFGIIPTQFEIKKHAQPNTSPRIAWKHETTQIRFKITKKIQKWETMDVLNKTLCAWALSQLKWGDLSSLVCWVISWRPSYEEEHCIWYNLNHTVPMVLLLYN